MHRGGHISRGAFRLAASRQRGFTLLETLVALVIAAAAAAVILSFLRTLMLRAEREQAHQLAVLQLLNDSVRSTYFRPVAAMSPFLDGDTLLLEGQSSEGGLPQIRVQNFSVRDEKLPPISFAYTPFQLFITERDRYAIHAVSAALPSPVSGDARLQSSSR